MTELSTGNPPLILASRSPRRSALLRTAGVCFTVQVPDVHEPEHQQGHPRAQALKTAYAKAQAVARGCMAPALVLAADTMVVLDGTIYNKPADAREARTMLTRLAGRTHQVLSAVVLSRVGGETLADVVAADVRFYPLEPALLEEYLASGESLDKAGGYGIQGLGARLVAEVRGDLTCVIGLPMRRVNGMVREMTGRDLFAPQDLPAVARAAFPDLVDLPESCLDGLWG